MTEKLEGHYRAFLRSEFEISFEGLLKDTEKDGSLGARNVRHASITRELLDWMARGTRPGVEAREYLEERLEAIDEVTGYNQAVYEHDAFAAAIEELR